MAYIFTRQELYDLVWSEPMHTLAIKYSITGTGLAKACKRTGIPVPERGYWNKLKAGKPVVKTLLPLRGLGKNDKIIIGSRYPWGHPWANHWHVSEEEILTCPIPPEPVFEMDMDAVRAKATTLVKKSPLPKSLAKPHYLISKLLAEDELRIQKKLASRYISSWDAPIFDNPFERRRLKILNGLLTCLGACGMRPSLSGKEGRDVFITVGDQQIPIFLDSINADTQIAREVARHGFTARGDKDLMRLTLTSAYSRNTADKEWRDTDTERLESKLRDVAIEIIVEGEKEYRSNEIFQRKNLVERKAEAEEKKIKRKLEAERQERERQARLEQERVDYLLGQAQALHKAGQIRAYVKAIQIANKTAPEPMSETELASWSTWALTQADRIDPLTSGSYKIRPQEG